MHDTVNTDVEIDKISHITSDTYHSAKTDFVHVIIWGNKQNVNKR